MAATPDDIHASHTLEAIVCTLALLAAVALVSWLVWP